MYTSSRFSLLLRVYRPFRGSSPEPLRALTRRSHFCLAAHLTCAAKPVASADAGRPPAHSLRAFAGFLAVLTGLSSRRTQGVAACSYRVSSMSMRTSSRFSLLLRVFRPFRGSSPETTPGADATLAFLFSCTLDVCSGNRWLPLMRGAHCHPSGPSLASLQSLLAYLPDGLRAWRRAQVASAA
jgi:hypothetical protein